MTYCPPLKPGGIPDDWRPKLEYLAYHKRGDDLPAWWWEMQETTTGYGDMLRGASSGALREIAKLEAEVDMLCAQIEDMDRGWDRSWGR